MEVVKLPFYARMTFILLGLTCTGLLFYLGQQILVPVMMSFLLAVLLRPIVRFFNKRLKFPHVLASIVAVILTCLLIVALFWFMSMQIREVVSDVNKIERNLTIHFHNLQQFVKDNFNVSRREQLKYINDASKDSIAKGKELIGTTLLSFTDTLLTLTLIPIYTFLILLYRNHFMKFLSMLFKKEHHEKLLDILTQIKVAVKSYIIGLILEMIAVSVLTAIGFMIIGVQYAILLGIITGILNMIPYIGILFAGLLSIIVSLTGSPDLSIIVGVIVVNIIVQLIDNNVFVPMLVNSKVEINAFVSIIGIIIGGALAGISGMFLAIPIIAVIKVICDRIDNLTPWGYLLGDDLPKTYVWKNIKLTRYSYENSSDTLNAATTQTVPSIYTQTDTDKNTHTTSSN